MGHLRFNMLQQVTTPLAIAGILTLTPLMARPTMAQMAPITPTTYNFGVNPLADYILGAGDILFVEVVSLHLGSQVKEYKSICNFYISAVCAQNHS